MRPGILKNGKKPEQNPKPPKRFQIDSIPQNDSNIPPTLSQSWIKSFFQPATIARNKQGAAKEKEEENRHYRKQLQNNKKYTTLFPQGSPYLNYANYQPNTQHHQRPVQRQYVQPVHQRQYVQPVAFPRGVPSHYQIFQHNGQYYMNPNYKQTNQVQAFAHGGKKQKTKKSKQNKKQSKKKT